MDKQEHNRPALLIGVLLILLTLAVFWQTQFHEFVIWDDHEYIVENPHVRTGLSLENALWAFKTTYASYWHPLTWLSHMLDCQIYGLNPRGHHFNNLLFHAANALLLFMVLRAMTGSLWKSAFVAALFAFHPLRVESVVWASQRKDVLAAFFWMLVMASYLRYVRRPGAGPYVLTLALFALGLMAKPTLVTLPFVLLLLDFWPLERFQKRGPGKGLPQALSAPPRREGKAWTKLVWEKAPFFLMAAGSGAVTFIAARGIGAVPTLQALSIETRLANACVSYVKYMGKMVWPGKLSFFYPHPVDQIPIWDVASAFLLILSISFLALVRSRRFPYLPVGWFWYLGTLTPVIGLAQVGVQGMANRFTYIPLVGLFVVIAWGIPDLVSKWPWRRSFLAAASIIVLSGLMVATRMEGRYWKDSFTLFERALRVTSGNYVAHFQMGNALMLQGDLDKAIDHYNRALRIRPDHGPSHFNMAEALAREGRIREALSHYSRALQINPGDWNIHYSLGNLLLDRGDLRAARSHYEKALAIDPGNWRVHNNLGMLLARQGAYPEAGSHFSAALRINPKATKARKNLETLLRKMNKADP